jgi:hypothetical protein
MKLVRPKKFLGQHFLKDLSVARAIADTIDACPDIPVLEVGPGMGVLTQYLLPKGREVKVAEIDFESVAYLRENFPALEPNIIEDDFLKMHLENTFEGRSFVLTGNYPYNISSQIFFKMLDYRHLIPCCTGMIQKEVAERLAAKPGTKAYGILSVLVQLWYDVDYLFTGVSNTDPMYNATKNDLMTYIYGKDNYTYAKVETITVNAGVERSGVVETWHQLKGADSTFGVAKENTGGIVLDIPEIDRLSGPYIALSTLSGEYGVMETLYALYQAAADNLESGSLIGDVEINIDTEQNKVIFNYDYKTVLLNASDIAVGEMAGQTVYNVNYFEVEVSFSYNDDYALTELWISCDCYTNDPGTSDVHGFLEQDVDLDYDPDTDEFTLRENALADNYTIHATQTVGERTEENPNPRSNFVPTSFEIFLTKNPTYDSNGLEQGYALADKLSGDVFCDIGDVVNLYISGYKPENTSLHFIADWVSYKLYKDGELVENPDDYLNPTAVAVFTFSGDLRSFFVIPREDGTYKLEIYAMDKKMGEVTIQAGVVSEDNLNLKDNEFAAKVTEAFEWSNEITFTATKAGKYYFYLPVGVGVIDADGYDAAEKTPETDDGPAPYYDYQLLDNRNPDGSYKAGTFTLDLEAGQTIRFYVNAAKRGTYVISYYVF